MSTNQETQTAPTWGEILPAWGVHIFTASGVVCGFLSLDYIARGQWRLAFIWMCAALIVDSVDGTMARKFRVKEVLPNIDGALLDNMIDYFNYVIIPAFFLYKANLLPEPWPLWGPVMISLVSAYQFVQSDAKTSDHYFKGFPSYWNVVVAYFMMLNLSPWTNLIWLIIFSVMVFIPIKYIYISRNNSRVFQLINLVLIIAWGALFVYMILIFPNQKSWMVYLSLVYPILYGLMSLGVTLQSWFRKDKN